MSWSGTVSRGLRAGTCLVTGDKPTQLWHIYSPVYSVVSNDHHEELYNITKYVMLYTKKRYKIISVF